jgi:hypothetical protein
MSRVLDDRTVLPPLAPTAVTLRLLTLLGTLNVSSKGAGVVYVHVAV